MVAITFEFINPYTNQLIPDGYTIIFSNLNGTTVDTQTTLHGAITSVLLSNYNIYNITIQNTSNVTLQTISNYILNGNLLQIIPFGGGSSSSSSTLSTSPYVAGYVINGSVTVIQNNSNNAVALVGI